MRTITATVLAVGFALTGLAPAAWAQQQEGQVAPAQRARTFDIPSQSLTDGLTLFGRQSGLQISVHGDLVRGLTTPGVSGLMTPEQALSRLLAGTGLVFSISGGSTVTLQKPGAGVAPGAIQLDPVQVQGYPVPQQALIDNLPPPYAGGQVATGGQVGLLGNRPVMDTPFNQTSYTAKKVQDQQARTVRDVLADDPSVRGYFPDGSIGNDELRIRGFSVAAAAGGATSVDLWLNHWGPAFDDVMEHPAAHGIVNTTSACAGRAIFDQDPTPVGDPATYFFYHEGHPSTAVHRIVGKKLFEEIAARSTAAR